MSAVTITCGACFHRGPADPFCRDVQGKLLPLDEYRCPVCGTHIRLVRETDGWPAPAVRVDIITQGRAP